MKKFSEHTWRNSNTLVASMIMQIFLDKIFRCLGFILISLDWILYLYHIHLKRASLLSVLAAVIWLDYYRYGVKYYPIILQSINQSINQSFCFKFFSQYAMPKVTFKVLASQVLMTPHNINVNQHFNYFHESIQQKIQETLIVGNVPCYTE